MAVVDLPILDKFSASAFWESWFPILAARKLAQPHSRNIEKQGDGFDVVQAMREAQPNCVRIILTGYAAFETEFSHSSNSQNNSADFSLPDLGKRRKLRTMPSKRTKRGNVVYIPRTNPEARDEGLRLLPLDPPPNSSTTTFATERYCCWPMGR